MDVEKSIQLDTRSSEIFGSRSSYLSRQVPPDTPNDRSLEWQHGKNLSARLGILPGRVHVTVDKRKDMSGLDVCAAEASSDGE